MKTQIKIDSKEVEAMFKRVNKQFSRDIVKALDVTSQKGIEMILNRTAKGRGYQTRFPSYNPQYAKFRQKKGRQSKFVDLNFTGKMTGAIRRKMDKPRLTAEIGFTRAAEATKAFYTNKKRPWFGFSTREQNFLKRFFYGRLIK